MEVITFVKGNVPDFKKEEFKSGYETLKKNPKPEGLVASYLLHDGDIYLIETVWESQSALDNMRSKEKPAATELFQKIGVKPELKVYNMISNI